MNTHKFKFSMGQIVYTVKQSSGYRMGACALCEGQSRIKIKDREIVCPDCYGRGFVQIQEKIKYIAHPTPLTIGQMRVSITDSPGIEGEEFFSNYKPQKGIHEEYMAIETGIGAGTLHYAEKLSATLADAQAMAEKMNSEESNG